MDLVSGPRLFDRPDTTGGSKEEHIHLYERTCEETESFPNMSGIDIALTKQSRHRCDRLVIVEFDHNVNESNPVKLQVCLVFGHVKVNMDRDQNELLKTVLNRLTLRLEQWREKESGTARQSKRRKLKKPAVTTAVALTEGVSASDSSPVDKPMKQLPLNLTDIVLCRADGSVVDPETTTCGEAFDSAVRMLIDGESCSVVRNPPRLKKVEISGDSVVGLPCVASFEARHEGDNEELVVEWYSSAPPETGSNDLTPRDLGVIQCDESKPLEKKAFLVHRGPWFRPRRSDVGLQLLVKGERGQCRACQLCD